MQSISKAKNLKNKKVIVRVDFNVPILNGRVVDPFRIKSSLETINFLIKKGARVVLITHLGNGSQSLDPVIKEFFRISKIPKDRVSFFENIRKFSGEEENSFDFAKEISKLGDIYVNEAFSVSHRNHASLVAITKFLPSYAGFNLEEEIKNLSSVFEIKKRPFLFILGGAKFNTKIPLIKKFLKLADSVFVGGALANTLFKEKGFNVGKSLIDNEKYDFSKILKNKKLILPSDVVVENANLVKNKKIEEVSGDDMIIDIGNETFKNLSSCIQKSKIILWNGPLGKYESLGDKATKELLKVIAKSNTKSILGGGDTVALVSKLKLVNKFTFVSTGGGATLDFLAHKTLPGIKALE